MTLRSFKTKALSEATFSRPACSANHIHVYEEKEQYSNNKLLHNIVNQLIASRIVSVAFAVVSVANGRQGLS